ncbi:MAG: secreted protein [Bacteroidetes bacterium]|nr:secreted protein [Bacteroidota bacterium]
MKKLFLAIALLIASTSIIQAQTMDKAIGIRITNGAELSFQNPLGSSTRAEVDFGIYSNNSVLLTGIHQWVFGLQEGLNWYAGLGPQVGLWDKLDHNGKHFALGVAGQVGIEYNFSIPVQVSLDYRPGFTIIPSGHNYNSLRALALGIRYRF